MAKTASTSRARVRREVRHVLLSVVLGFGAFALLLALFLHFATGMALVWQRGFHWMAFQARQLAGVQRRRLGVPSLYPPLPDEPAARDKAMWSDPATLRDLAWLGTQAALAPIGLGLLVCLPLGIVGMLTPLFRWLLPPDVVFDYQWIPVPNQRVAWLLVLLAIATFLAPFVLNRYYIEAESFAATRLLAPTGAALLGARVEKLSETRAAVVDASAAELRRIERDLHDGAQARLVALAMNLGMAEDLFESRPEVARAMLAEARADARSAMGELRDLVKGIHPPILTDRGLPGAVLALSIVSSIPIDLDVRIDRRLPAPMEAAAYFALAELVANAIKHSGASLIRLSVVDDGARLLLHAFDDGSGGADPAGGSGLAGIRRRFEAFDGSVRVDSPFGGPTLVEMELPCGS